MLRQTSFTETTLTYATFLAISLVIHMVVILGTRERPPATPPPPSTPSEERQAAHGSSQ